MRVRGRGRVRARVGVGVRVRGGERTCGRGGAHEGAQGAHGVGLGRAPARDVDTRDEAEARGVDLLDLDLVNLQLHPRRLQHQHEGGLEARAREAARAARGGEAERDEAGARRRVEGTARRAW